MLSYVVTLLAGEGFRIPVRLCIFLNPHRCALRKVFFVRLWVWQTQSAKPTTAQGVFVSPAAKCEVIEWGKAYILHVTEVVGKAYILHVTEVVGKAYVLYVTEVVGKSSSFY